MAEHTQGPGMGPERAAKREPVEGSNGRDPSIWSVMRVGGGKQRRSAGLDVLLIKAAVEFQNLKGDERAAEIQRDCEALREALGVDALIVAHFDADQERIERVIGAAGLFATYNPQVLCGERLNAFPYL